MLGEITLVYIIHAIFHGSPKSKYSRFLKQLWASFVCRRLSNILINRPNVVHFLIYPQNTTFISCIFPREFRITFKTEVFLSQQQFHFTLSYCTWVFYLLSCVVDFHDALVPYDKAIKSISFLYLQQMSSKNVIFWPMCFFLCTWKKVILHYCMGRK